MNLTDFADLLNKFEQSKDSNKKFLLSYAFNPEFECKYGFSEEVIDEAVSFLEYADVAGVEEIKDIIEKINKWRSRYFGPDYTGMDWVLKFLNMINLLLTDILITYPFRVVNGQKDIDRPCGSPHGCNIACAYLSQGNPFSLCSGGSK